MAKTKESKRYKKCAEVRSSEEHHSVEKALELLSQMPTSKFDESVELSVRLNADPRQGNQMVRGTVSLPHGSGKKIKVIAFTSNAQEALDAGADEAGLEDLIKKVQDGWMDFDVAVATPEAMKEIRTLARVLGPRGLMPNPKSGTVTDNIPEGIQAVKAGRVEFKMDKTANMAILVGKRSFDLAKLAENIAAAIDALAKARPEAVKGSFVKSLTLSSTMSAGVKLDKKLIPAL